MNDHDIDGLVAALKANGIPPAFQAKLEEQMQALVRAEQDGQANARAFSEGFLAGAREFYDAVKDKLARPTTPTGP